MNSRRDDDEQARIRDVVRERFGNKNVCKPAPVSAASRREQQLLATQNQQRPLPDENVLGSSPAELLYAGNLRTSVEALPYGGNIRSASSANDRQALRKLASLRMRTHRKHAETKALRARVHAARIIQRLIRRGYEIRAARAAAAADIAERHREIGRQALELRARRSESRLVMSSLFGATTEEEAHPSDLDGPSSLLDDSLESEMRQLQEEAEADLRLLSLDDMEPGPSSSPSSPSSALPSSSSHTSYALSSSSASSISGDGSASPVRDDTIPPPSSGGEITFGNTTSPPDDAVAPPPPLATAAAVAAAIPTTLDVLDDPPANNDQEPPLEPSVDDPHEDLLASIATKTSDKANGRETIFSGSLPKRSTSSPATTARPRWSSRFVRLYFDRLDFGNFDKFGRLVHKKGSPVLLLFIISVSTFETDDAADDEASGRRRWRTKGPRVKESFHYLDEQLLESSRESGSSRTFSTMRRQRGEIVLRCRERLDGPTIEHSFCMDDSLKVPPPNNPNSRKSRKKAQTKSPQQTLELKGSELVELLASVGQAQRRLRQQDARERQQGELVS